MRRPSFVRLTYFEGLQVPQVEIWEQVGTDCEDKPRYAYTRTGAAPQCETESDWHAALMAAELFTFGPIGDDDAESRGESRDEQRVANGSYREDGVPSPQGGTPKDDGVLDRADEVDSGR